VSTGRESTRELLYREPWDWEFFQAVRLLALLTPERELVGGAVDPMREIVRFRTRPSLEFPASQVYALARVDGDARPPEMTVNFLGLTGPLGVLPHAYTELLIERARYKDTALWQFLDLFSHRFVSLFYRAWEKYRFAVAYERTGEEPVTENLFSLIGLGTAGLRGRLGVPDQALLFYAGLVGQRPHSASAVEAVLSDYFGVPIALEPFVGQWLQLEPENLSRLGAKNSELGATLVLGERVWDRPSKFRLRVGPLDAVRFTTFLPPGPAFAPLVALARFLVGLELDFDVQLVLAKNDVPGIRLGGGARSLPMLGWTTWLQTGPRAADADDVVLEPPSPDPKRAPRAPSTAPGP
jgi:type VI secretion system protein ImpH